LIRRIATLGLGIPAPPKKGEASRRYLPRGGDAKAEPGCRKRRNRVPDWSEIRCRFPPKSPADFDRNQVPVCSDFCIDDLSRKTHPGYPLYGRMKGLAELRGVMHAVAALCTAPPVSAAPGADSSFGEDERRGSADIGR
jgi:hypothetical protein